ncbi:Hypothetical protein LUCI_0944 [Lucifera butyrica]|uniref:Uncharacterized protein n=1 Tax=Lucifera butyrica TaxID=1351585 RepID=A0A498R688_9FIRM|nr:CC/Se motif family (seleno)protein [Lucifera butyrica]VBB05733.1 Hypothetical protein LUCI_0944 [Lucifera butyrica]
MDIILEPDARNYIMEKNKDKAVTIEIVKRPGSCCVGDAQVPSTRLGRIGADKTHSYRETAVDGITVYYHEDLPALYRCLVVKTEKLLFFKHLAVSGEY